MITTDWGGGKKCQKPKRRIWMEYGLGALGRTADYSAETVYIYVYAKRKLTEKVSRCELCHQVTGSDEAHKQRKEETTNPTEENE